MRRFVLILMFFSAAVTVACAADNPFKTARAAIKSGQNLEKAETGLIGHATSREVAPSERAKAYNMAAQVAERINAAENEKLYLKQNFDTVRFFNSLLRMYQHVERCDSIEREPDENGRVKRQFLKANAKLKSRHRKNLLEGGKWMMARQRWGEAYSFYNTYCSADPKALAADTMRLRIAYWASTCAYKAGDMKAMLRYVDDALDLHLDEANLIECKSAALLATGDSTGWERTLVQGLERFPCHFYFFERHNYHLRLHKRFDEALQLAKQLYSEHPDSTFFLYGIALTCFEKGDMDGCIEAFDELLRIQPDCSGAYLYVGAAWVKKATAFANAASYELGSAQYREERKRLAQMYRSALSPLEKYRELRPDDMQHWKPLLYKVYYSLNMGDELYELENVAR